MQAKLKLLNVKKSSLKSKNSQYYFCIFNFKGRYNLLYFPETCIHVPVKNMF